MSAGRVALLERNRRCGRKLLLTGSGQCNITRGGPIESFFPHYGGKERFVAPALREYSNWRLIETLTAGSLPLEEREDGKIFPTSRRSADVLDYFLRTLRALGGQIHSETTVTAVEKIGERFRVQTSRGVFLTRTLTLAAGGCSYPKTGSNGDGFRLAASLGHTIVTPHPALTSVTIAPWRYAVCAGIALRGVSVTLDRENERVGRFSGDLLWTHHGLSGPVILDASRLMRKGDRLTAALLPFADRATLDAALRDVAARSPNRFVGTLLTDFGLPERLVREIFTVEHLPYERLGSALTRGERLAITELFSAFSVRIQAPDGWDRAMTTAGGVALSEVNRLTMASRLVPGLFFAGETLDVDGDTGGFNLQFAWSSGSLAGRSAAHAVLKK